MNIHVYKYLHNIYIYIHTYETQICHLYSMFQPFSGISWSIYFSYLQDAAPRLPPLPMMMSPPKSLEAETSWGPAGSVNR